MLNVDNLYAATLLQKNLLVFFASEHLVTSLAQKWINSRELFDSTNDFKRKKLNIVTIIKIYVSLSNYEKFCIG